jgi:hypothetical protein
MPLYCLLKIAYKNARFTNSRGDLGRQEYNRVIKK